MTPQTTTFVTHLYPPAPWQLNGRAWVSLSLIDIKLVRSYIPKELEIVQLLPGKTLGGLYIATYEISSTLTYNELIVFGGLTRRGRQMGAWVTHIYVDNPRSIAGGREIWGLPKQMARFHWIEGDSAPHDVAQGISVRPQVTVYRNELLLCSLSYRWQTPGIPLSLPPGSGSFSTVGNDLVWFSATGNLTPHLLVEAQVDLACNSPFSLMGLENLWFAVSCENLRLQVNAPIAQNVQAIRPINPAL
jgi:hypothetical protein